MKKILVPVDFSEESTNAVDLAIQIARKSDAEVILLHVLEKHNEQHFNVTGEMDLTGSQADNIYFIELFKKTKKDLIDIVENDNYSDISIIGLLKTGSIYQRISDIITAKNINLVIMGSKGASGIKELLIGSNTEKVIRHVKCPVLTVKEKTDLSLMKKLAFVTDLSERQHNVVSELKDFVALLGLEFIILKINTHHHLLPDKSLLNKQLYEYADKHQLEATDLQIYNDDYVEEGVVRFASEEHIDIIALGTHGRTGIAHIIAGSIAENLVNHEKRLIWTCSY